MSIYQEFENMINKETDSDMIDAVWRWDFDKIREIRKKNKRKLKNEGG